MSHLSPRSKRLAGGVLAGAMALAVAPVVSLTSSAFAADPAPPVAEPIGDGNVCENAPDQEPFIDVTQADNSYDEIVCLFQSGITKGKTETPPTYAPGGTLTRREMALFLKRTADTADANDTGGNIRTLPAYDGTEDYSDIGPEGQPQKEAIGQLSQVEIALGFPDGTYRPGDILTRRQMAKFIVREIEFLTGDTLTANGDYFDDDNGQDAESEFNKLAELGIFIGDGEGNVDPGGDLSRRQMANILLRTLEVLFEDGDITGLFASDADAAVTTRPELLDADIVSTADSGTVIRFAFDEEITGTQAPVANLFHAYDKAGEQFDGSGTPVIESGGSSALVTFADVDGAAEAEGLTVATVDFGAVQDDEGSQNPIGDAPLGTSSDSTTTFTPGSTEAPDLATVQNFRTDAADPARTLVDFAFDENAFVVDEAGFALVTTSGELIDCVASDNTTTTEDTTDFAGDGTTAITTSCANTTVTGPISAGEVARGFVEAGTVSDADQPANPVPVPGFPGGEPAGNLNARQATDTPDAGSTEPDLVSAELRFNPDQGEGTQDTVLFTFSEPVVLTAEATPIPPTTAAEAAGAQFLIYTDEATEIAGQSAVRGSTASQVLVTYEDGEIDRAVGASVDAGAVRAQTGDSSRTNDVDEEGVANSGSVSQTRTAGRTDNPDLTAVRIETSTTTGDPQAVFAFDEDVDLVETDDSFYLLLSSGARLVCVDGNASNPTPDASDDTVLCTSFAVANAAGEPTADLASDDQVRSAVAGSVDDDAVVGENDSPTATTNGTTDTSLAFGNPEGANVTIGGTGTPQS